MEWPVCHWAAERASWCFLTSEDVTRRCHQKMSPEDVTKRCHQKMIPENVTRRCHQIFLSGSTTAPDITRSGCYQRKTGPGSNEDGGAEHFPTSYLKPCLAFVLSPSVFSQFSLLLLCWLQILHWATLTSFQPIGPTLHCISPTCHFNRFDFWFFVSVFHHLMTQIQKPPFGISHVSTFLNVNKYFNSDDILWSWLPWYNTDHCSEHWDFSPGTQKCFASNSKSGSSRKSIRSLVKPPTDWWRRSCCLWGGGGTDGGGVPRASLDSSFSDTWMFEFRILRSIFFPNFPDFFLIFNQISDFLLAFLIFNQICVRSFFWWSIY